MKIVKGVINAIVAFFLTIAIVANFVIILISNTILDKNYMFGLLEENGYYEKVATDLQNGFEEYKYQSGLPDEVFQNLYAENELRKDINSIINNLYDGTEITNSSENVRVKITENVNRYLSENNITVNEEMQKNITDYENLIVNVYENKVNSAFSYVKDVNPMINKIQSVVEVAKWILLGGLVVIAIFALLLNLRSMGLFASVIGTALLASGTLLTILNFVIQKNIDIEHILLFAQSFSDFIKYIIYHLLEKINFYGILFIVVGIVGIVISSYNRYKDE